MKIIKLGNREVKLLGTPMTPFHYKKAFNQSFSGDLIALSEMGGDLSKFDDINLLQMIWAMERTANKDIKPFENWLADFESLDLYEVVEDVVEEGLQATFRKA